MGGDSRTASDVVIVGGGFAGSLLALVLARSGHAVEVVDLHEVHPAEFRCEKLGAEQAARLQELGALEPIAARAGVAAAEITSVGLPYGDMVNALRDAWPDSVGFRRGRAAGVRTSDEFQEVELSSGESIAGRLLVFATGRNERLRRSIGVERRTLRDQHSLCIGFSLAPTDGRPPLPALIAHGGRGGDGLGFVSLFPMGDTMRVNLFCYRDPNGAWVRSFRQDPLAGLVAAFPALAEPLAGAQVVAAPEFGVIDLYRTEGCIQPGVVLIGDAFCSSCPATAMGLTRVLADVRQLALVHAPEWLKTPGMGAAKIAGFYADPLKRSVDRRSRRRAELGRFEATARGPAGAALRAARRLRRRLAA
jgi:2-polyprenyl-6-methoxyphenol hydroxylase-like FAD-dependent oxidoreductase